MCRHFRWKCHNGTLAVRATRELLVRLEQDGLIQLPAPRGRRGARCLEAVEIAANALSQPAELSVQPSIDGDLVVRPIDSDELLGWRAAMARFHYLGDAPVVGESLRYAAFLDDALVALLGWGSAALNNRPRDEYIGWDSTAKRAHLHQVINNVRFLILPWIRVPHLASRVLGANLRRLSRDWEEVYGHTVLLAETFVDRSRFRGTCYRASNWIEVGQTQGWSKHGLTYEFTGRPKSVWLYPLVPDIQQHLRSPNGGQLSKERFMTRIDVEKLPLVGHGGLFEILTTVSDQRKRRGKRHGIESIIALSICAAMSGAKSIVAIAEFAAELPSEILKKLGSKRGRPPSERTIRRVLKSVDADEVDRKTGHWVAQQEQQLAGKAIAIDGKTLRGSGDKEKGATHLLSAVIHGSGTVVAQTSVDTKTNEITRVEPLFADLDIAGATVTADALLTQKNIARYIVEEKHADYVFVVKDNQPTLRQDIETLNLDAFSPSAHHDG